MDTSFPITLPPGFFSNDSPYAVKGRYTNGSMVRSFDGKMQKWAGWGNFQGLSTTEPARGRLVWTTNDGRTLLALGTANRLWLYKEGARHNITPQGLTVGLVDTNTTDSGYGAGGYGSGPYGGGFSAQAGQGSFPRVWTMGRWGEDLVCCPRGEPIYFWDYSAANIGLTMTATLTDGSTTISVLSNAAAIKVGDRVGHNFLPTDTFVVSVNVGAATAVLTNASNGPTTAGQTLTFTTPAINIDTLTADARCPTTALAIFVTDDRHLVALGAAVPPTTYDALNVAWCNREDFLVWTPAATNTAGAIRCETGNQIMGATRAVGSQLIITDLSAHTFRFIGGDDVFGLDRIGATGGAIGPLAMVEVDGTAYWMGFHNFYWFNGKVNTLPCSIHRDVFNNLNRAQLYKIYADTNRRYGEVVWFLPGTLTSLENDSYVTLNTFDGTWSRGGATAGPAFAFGRTTWIDSHALFRTPLGVDGLNLSTGAGGNDLFTKVLLQFNGTDPTRFHDSNAGGGAHTWTGAGNAQLSQTAPLKFGTYLLCDGVGDFVSTPDHADFAPGSGAFTVDLQARPAVDGSLMYACGQLDAVGAANANSAWYIARTAANKIEFGVVQGTTVTTVTSTTNVIAGAFYHIAGVRTADTLKLFINGVQEGGDVSFSGSINDSTAVLAIGRAGALASNEWNGGIDGFRLSSIARWTANFTPPAHEYGSGIFKLYQHESGITADGALFAYLLETGELELKAESITGDTYLRLKKVVPDYAYLSGQHDLTVLARGYPRGPEVTKGPYAISESAALFNPKARGRSFRFRMGGTGDFRLGDTQAYATPDGGRQ